MPAKHHFVFDAYGTLFDVHSAAARLRDRIGVDWERMSQVWRAKQLEYTWVHSQTGRYVPFSLITARSLDYALAATGIEPRHGIRDELLAAYRTLQAYPEVSGVLDGLKADGAKLAILSNGDLDMLEDAVTTAGLSGVFDAVLSVASAGVFKPASAVYALATCYFDCTPQDITFVSSNRWDIAGAHVFGFRTNWINRAGLPDEYPDMPAAFVSPDLTSLLTLAARS